MQNWKTTVAGALSAFGLIVGPISGFLASLQAIQAQTPGHGPADYRLAIVGAALTTLASIARIWIGLIQTDAPAPPSSTISAAELGAIALNPTLVGAAEQHAISATTKLGVIALICLLLIAPMTACSAKSVAQDIVNWTPALDAAASTIATLDPALLPEAAGFIAVTGAVKAEAAAYLATPTATALQRLQVAVVTAQQAVNVALLDAVKIGRTQDGAAHAVAALQTYLTIVNTILALVVSVSTKGQVAAMASASPVKLAEVEPYAPLTQAGTLVAAHYGIDWADGMARVIDGQDRLAAAGF